MSPKLKIFVGYLVLSDGVSFFIGLVCGNYIL